MNTLGSSSATSRSIQNSNGMDGTEGHFGSHRSTRATLCWPADDCSRVPFAAYHDPAIYEEEQARIFRGPTWNYLALEAEIPNPGDFLTTYVGDTPVLVTRARDGAVRAFVNRCAHRGALLRREACGNAKTHACIYHQWSYGLDGALLGVPFPRGVKGEGGLPPDFDKSKIRLTELVVQACRGVLFGSFSGAVEPLHDYLDRPVTDQIERLFAKPIRILGYQRQRIFGNWKLYNDNVRDPNHGGLLHMFHATFGLARLSQIGGSHMDRRHRHNIVFTHRDTDDAEAQSCYSATTNRVYQEGY